MLRSATSGSCNLAAGLWCALQAVHDKSRCVFQLGKFTTFADGLAATMQWAQQGGFNAAEYAARAAVSGGWGAERTELVRGAHDKRLVVETLDGQSASDADAGS